MGEHKFRIGDKVWDVRMGWVRVEMVNTEGVYTIAVRHKNGISSFTKDGKLLESDLYPSLFFREITIPKEALQRPRWRAEKGGSFFYINVYGEVETAADYRDKWCNKLFDVENYFQAVEEAMESKHYKVFHD